MSLWNYRGFIFESVKRDFQAKYRNSLFGISWAIINPFAMIFIYTIVFSSVMKTKLPQVHGQFSYSIFLCSGILTWGLFSEITTRMQNMFFEYGNILKKVNFPHLCLPIIIILNALLNFFIIFSLFMGFLLFSNAISGWSIISFIPLLLLQVVFSASLGLCLSVLNVFFRDIGQLFSIILQFWFWLTPIVYPIYTIPEKVQSWLWYNPMTHFISAYQKIFIYNEWPPLASVYLLLTVTFLFLFIGFRLFRKLSAEILDEI